MFLAGCSGAGNPGTFKLDLRYVSSPSGSQKALFERAAARWSRVITVGLPSVNLAVNTNSSNTCGSDLPAFFGRIHSVLVDVVVKPIDGVGKVLGSSGPCLIRKSSGLPGYGVLILDSADLADLEARGLLEATVTHELGHVLGFGTLWSQFGLVTGAGDGAHCGSNPQYIGPNAVREWQGYGGAGNVPLETVGGLGTCDSHWRESVFGDELMTGFIDTATPLSRVTVGAMQDLGYTVNYEAADRYSLPAAINSQSLGQPLNTVPIFPKGTIDDR